MSVAVGGGGPKPDDRLGGAPPRALAIGGLDPSAGAGVLLDAFVMARLGYQPALVAATVTAQNSVSFLGQWPVGSEALLAQLDAVAAEGPIACVKTGALGSAKNALAIAEWLAQADIPVVVCDPVLASSSGGELIIGAIDAVDALARVATVVTPNAVEALRLASVEVDATCAALSDAALSAAAKLAERWGAIVIVTGLSGSTAEEAVDLVVTDEGVAEAIAHPLVTGVGDVRGTGCMLASALACALASGRTPPAALEVAHTTVRELLGEAKAIGRGRLQVDLTRLAGH
jgi:hydroxymethylpyrimidine/phosphomethylpyrimidine kinase